MLVLLALVLPGYAIAAALFPPGGLPPAERLVYAVGFSMAATVLTGIVAQQVVDPGRVGWGLLLAAVTVGAFAVALWRRELRGEALPGRPPRPPAVAPHSLAAIVAAVALAGVAVAVASDGAHEERAKSRFTALSALPRESAGGQRVAIEVLNREGHRSAYVVRVTGDGGPLSSRRVSLADGARWRRTLPVPQISSLAPLRVELLRGGRPYRPVELQFGGPG